MKPSDFLHRTLTVNEIDLHVVEIGQGDPVVLIHGFPQHWWMWRTLMRDLAAKGFRVIAYDQRGMGGSSITQGGYDKRSLAKDLAGLLDALNIQRQLWLDTTTVAEPRWPLRLKTPYALVSS
jgi:pimeloyl-ACP methyl ester carboxylesterase